MNWIRARFKIKLEINDPRPASWPPVGPYWITGEGSDCNYTYTIVAYVKVVSQILDQWPEATDIEIENKEEITYTSRFTKPDWWEQCE